MAACSLLGILRREQYPGSVSDQCRYDVPALPRQNSSVLLFLFVAPLFAVVVCDR